MKIKNKYTFPDDAEMINHFSRQNRTQNKKEVDQNTFTAVNI